MNIPDFYLEPANYTADFEDIQHVRQLVFVAEQNIPEELEFDELDHQCHHILARDSQGRAIGTGRLTNDGKLGRMAVVQECRHQRVGESLLRGLIEKARALGLSAVTASAQISALGFYAKYGFRAEGETYLEAGIPHQRMRLPLQPQSQTARPIAKPKAPSVQAVRLDTIESTVAASRQLISQARRKLFIYSRDLDYAIYGRSDILEALKQFALGQRNSEVQIIIQDPASLRNQTHPAIQLAQRLSSHFLLRAPLEAEDIQYLSAFIVDDVDGYLFRLLGDRYEGHWSPRLPAQNRKLREEFERVWQRSRPCSEFRALGL